MCAGVGQRIRALREARGWSQGQLLIQARSYSPSGRVLARETISRIENEHRDPQIWALDAIAEALSVSTDYLLGLSDDPGIAISAMPIPELELVDLVARLNSLDPGSRARGGEPGGELAFVTTRGCVL